MAMEVIDQNWLQMEIPTKRSVCCANKNYNYVGKYMVISQVKINLSLMMKNIHLCVYHT